jgi:hypothetical protein
MSVMLFVAFTGSQQVDWRLRHIDGPKPFTHAIRVYEPPARKSVIVGTDGQAHPIAAPTHATKRDRSRTIYRSVAPAPVPHLDVIRDDFQLAKPLAVMPKTEPEPEPAPVRTEASLIAPAPVAILAPKQALIDADDSYRTAEDLLITNRVRKAIVSDNALYVVSMHVRVNTDAGIVTLIGEVSTQREKNVFEEKALSVAGAGNVKNELSVLVQ